MLFFHYYASYNELDMLDVFAFIYWCACRANICNTVDCKGFPRHFAASYHVSTYEEDRLCCTPLYNLCVVVLPHVIKCKVFNVMSVINVFSLNIMVKGLFIYKYNPTAYQPQRACQTRNLERARIGSCQ